MSTPSVLAQGFDAAFVRGEPLVRNYNSGLLRKDGHLFLATRRFNRERWRCDIVINRLADDGSATPVLELALPRASGMENLEDGRLFWHAGKIHLAYTEGHYWMRPWVAIQKLAVLGDDWTVQRTVTIAFGHNTTGQEKNWQFFTHRGRLHFVYSISPHVVVELGDDYQPARVNQRNNWLPEMIRGGTPPVRVGDDYVSFFHYHESHPTRSRRYFMGAYKFDNDFKVRGATSALIAASEEDPTLPNLCYPHWQPVVVFPCGALLEDGQWTVTAGINDSFDAIFRIPHEALQFHAVTQRRPASR